MAIAQTIGASIEEIGEVKRWIDNDIEAGDTMIQEHSDRLQKALADLEQARTQAEELAAAE